MKSKNPSKTKVAILGGGIFGATAAYVLARSGFKVTLFEKNPHLFSGASLINHNRHHFGFHYPRSPQTARQCMESRDSFNSLYADSLIADFDNYYCVGKDSRLAANEYLAFCTEMNLPFIEQMPPHSIVDSEKIVLGLKVEEPIYNLDKLRSICIGQLNSPRILVLPNHEVTNATENGDFVSIRYSTPGLAEKIEEFDHVVNATYARYNQFCHWLGFEKREFQFNLQELCILKLPLERHIGITIMDGEFPSFLPFGNTGFVLFAHVIESQLARETSQEKQPLLNRSLAVVSNWKKTVEASSQIIPILKKAEYQKSFFIDRVVDAKRAVDDGRISEVISHSKRCWSIFSAKIITSVSTANSLAARLEKN
jgi:hypothetical protein